MENTAIYEMILSGKVRVKVERVARSGMFRCLSIYSPEFENITRYFASKVGSFTKDGYLRVSGCGMDMCLNTLYCFLPYELAKNRSQHYLSMN